MAIKGPTFHIDHLEFDPNLSHRLDMILEITAALYSEIQLTPIKTCYALLKVVQASFQYGG